MSALEDELAAQIRLCHLPEFVREFKFHSTRRWKADFAWPDVKLLAEVEGGIWNGGAHVRGKHYESDCEKYNEAALLGYRVIRVSSGHIKSGQALKWIEAALKEKN